MSPTGPGREAVDYDFEELFGSSDVVCDEV